MKIQANQVLKNLKGEPLKDPEQQEVTLGKAISNIILQGKEGGRMKLYILAKKFYEQEQVEVDASDLALIKRAVGATDIYNALVAGQCEELLEEVKETN